jgi:diadenylate cyclase
MLSLYGKVSGGFSFYLPLPFIPRLTLSAQFPYHALWPPLTVSAGIGAGLAIVKTVLTVAYSHFHAVDRGFTIRVVFTSITHGGVPPSAGFIPTVMFNSTPLKGQIIFSVPNQASLTEWKALGYILERFKGFRMFEHLCQLNPGCDRDVMQSIITLAVELAREGREGRRVGAIFVVGDEDTVLALSRPMILDPLACHETPLRHILDPDLRETVKELSLLDGAFVVSEDGTFIAACRYLSADARGIAMPMGLGSRHLSAAAITRSAKCTAVVLSESAVVRVFFKGEMVAEIVPDIWMLSREMTHLEGDIEERQYAGVRVFSLRRQEDEEQ